LNLELRQVPVPNDGPSAQVQNASEKEYRHIVCDGKESQGYESPALSPSKWNEKYEQPDDGNRQTRKSCLMHAILVAEHVMKLTSRNLSTLRLHKPNHIKRAPQCEDEAECNKDN
jgi:hypothetical protein